MQIEQTRVGRVRINDSGYETSFVIPAAKPYFYTMFLVIWSAGWGVIGYSIVSDMLGLVNEVNAPPHAFSYFWLAGWVAGLGYALFTLARIFFGRELVELKPEWLAITEKLFFYSRVRRYDYTNIRNLKIVLEKGFDFSNKNFGVKKPVIWFDYRMTTVKFGDKLNENEAQTVAIPLKQRIS